MHTLLVPLILAAVQPAQMWYSLPLIVAISLVYAGTRHEDMPDILKHALRLGVWIVVFMAIVFVLLLFM